MYKNIPALLFVRGDMIDLYGTDSLIRAVRNGFLLGNHAVSHTHFQNLPYDTMIAEIEEMETRINDIYHKAGVKRPGLYFRFPHMDRGAGGYIVDYSLYPSEQRDFVTRLFTDGVRVELKTPSAQQLAKKDRMQTFLKERGFIQPFKNVTFPWYRDTEMDAAADCMYTFSTSDWMLLNRHKGKWKYKTLQDLKDKINNDPFLNQEKSHSIILIHDKPEAEFPSVFKSLVDHMVIKGYDFLTLP
jgi:peptidoglycan/xylan/chitin deacetylase (PgdA/CDA1 family)